MRSWTKTLLVLVVLLHLAAAQTSVRSLASTTGGSELRMANLLIENVSSNTDSSSTSGGALYKGARVPCLEAKFSALIPTAGLSGPLEVWSACELEKLSRQAIVEKAKEAHNAIVFLAADECRTSMKSIISTVATQSYIRALIVDHAEGSATPVVPLPASLVTSSEPKVPTCSISGSYMDAFYRNRATATQVRLTNSRTENVLVQTRGCALQSVYIDGQEQLQSSSGETTASFAVLKDYRAVAIRLQLTHSKPSFAMSVSGGTNIFKQWRCTQPQSNTGLGDSILGDWNEDNAFMFSTHTRDKVLLDTVVQEVVSHANLASSSGPATNTTFWWMDSSKVESDAGQFVTCFSLRPASSISRHNFRYEYISSKMDFEDAKNFCQKERAGSLVSIHSQAENMLISSLIPWAPFSTGTVDQVFIGLQAKGAGLQTWEDDTRFDYHPWGTSVQTGPGRTAKCVVMKYSDGEPVWEYASCEESHPFVCKSATFTVTDDCTDESQETCFLYYKSADIALPLARPQAVEETYSGMCSYGSQVSCCSTSVIDSILGPFQDELMAKIESATCRQSLQNLACSLCLPAAHKFATWDMSYLTMRWCRNTCLTIYEDCKEEAEFQSQATEFEADPCNMLIEVYKTGHQNAMNLKFEVMDGNSAECLRIDNRAPALANVTLPTDGSQLIRLVFNEQVEVSSGTVALIRDSEQALEIPLATSEQVSLTTSRILHDTVEIDLSGTPSDKANPDTNADASNVQVINLPPGNYSIFVSSFAIVDMAGNVYPGSYTSDTPITFQIGVGAGDNDDDDDDGDDENSSFSMGSIVSMFFWASIFGAMAAAGYAIASQDRDEDDSSAGGDAPSSFRESFADSWMQFRESVNDRLGRGSSPLAPGDYTLEDDDEYEEEVVGETEMALYPTLPSEPTASASLLATASDVTDNDDDEAVVGVARPDHRLGRV